MNETEIELLKHKLADHVRTNVERKIFRVYVLMGVVAVAAFSYANWDFVSDTKKEVQRNANTAVDEAIKASQDKIDGLTEAVNKQFGRIEETRERADRVRAEVSAQLRQLNYETHNLESLNETVTSLAESRRQLEVDVDAIKARAETLTVLGEELRNIAVRLKTLDADNSQEYVDAVGKLDNVTNDAEERANRPTVYMQFAGGARSRAQELSKLLEAKNFFVPGEERLSAAAGKREVRYFHAEDETAAKRLVEDATQALKDMHYSDKDVSINNLTDFGGAKPKPGVLELWVEL